MLGHIETNELAYAFGIFIQAEEILGVFGLRCTTITRADRVDENKIGLI